LPDSWGDAAVPADAETVQPTPQAGGWTEPRYSPAERARAGIVLYTAVTVVIVVILLAAIGS